MSPGSVCLVLVTCLCFLKEHRISLAYVNKSRAYIVLQLPFAGVSLDS